MTTIPFRATNYVQRTESINTTVHPIHNPEAVARRQATGLKRFEALKLFNIFYDKVHDSEWFGSETAGQLRLHHKVSTDIPVHPLHCGILAETYHRGKLISVLTWLHSKLPVDSPIQDRITNILSLSTSIRSDLVEIIGEGLLAIGHIFPVDYY